MAEPGAVIHVVGPETGTDQLLEQIGFLVRAFGGAKARQRASAMGVADVLEARGGAVERLLPGGGPEMRPRIARIDDIVDMLRHTFPADHRLSESIRIVDVIEAEPALHAQPVVISGTILAGHIEQLVVLDVITELAADAAVGTNRANFAIRVGAADIVVADQR